jgi:hypothetical protein
MGLLSCYRRRIDDSRDGLPPTCRNKFIPGYHRRTLRTKRSQLHSCGISRRGINYQMQMSHTSIGTAINTFQHKQKPSLRSSIFEKMRNPSTYPSQSPLCECPVEDFHHAFRCPNWWRWQFILRNDMLSCSSIAPTLTLCWQTF